MRRGFAATLGGALGLGLTAAAFLLAASRPPQSSAWPNEPPGLRVISDQPFDALPSLGWQLVWNDSGYARATTDRRAPFSPPGVAQFAYPVTFPGGIAPGTAVRDLPDLTRVYVGLWWWASRPWQGHRSNVNKIQFLFPSSGGDIYMAMYGSPRGPYELRVSPQFPGQPSGWLEPNVARVPVVLGEWHRIEWLLVYHTSAEPPNGIVRWWLDGRLVGSYLNVRFPAGGMVSYKLSPTWGGVGDTKTERDYFRFDHVRISGR